VGSTLVCSFIILAHTSYVLGKRDSNKWAAEAMSFVYLHFIHLVTYLFVARFQIDRPRWRRFDLRTEPIR